MGFLVTNGSLEFVEHSLFFAYMRSTGQGEDEDVDYTTWGKFGRVQTSSMHGQKV